MRKQKKKIRHNKQTHNRQYKDRLWRMIFNNKEDLLQLYNAINHTDYQNPDDPPSDPADGNLCPSHW